MLRRNDYMVDYSGEGPIIMVACCESFAWMVEGRRNLSGSASGSLWQQHFIPADSDALSRPASSSFPMLHWMNVGFNPDQALAVVDNLNKNRNTEHTNYKMVLTDDVHLPTPQELEIEEIPLTHNYMLASAMWLGKYCDNQSKEFMLCRHEEGDPRKCVDYGKEVTKCGMDFFKKVKKSCREEFEWYNKCLDWTGKEPNFRRCRHEQALFDGCMYDAGFERAKFGHFQMLRVHESERPKPKPIVPIFPDAVEPYDYKEGRKPTQHGVFGWAAASWFN